jgi:surface antigen
MIRSIPVSGRMCAQVSPRFSYNNASLRARLQHRAGAPIVIILALAASCGGCSFSYQLGSLFGKDDDTPSASATGTVEPADAVNASAEVDLAYARAAATEVLASGDKLGSAHWENPRTGARGMVTPIANAYIQDGVTCREFLASYVRDGNEAWLQGEACRLQHGKWEVRSLKPWKRV